MQPEIDLDALTDVVMDVLLRCRKLGLANMQVDPEDLEVIEGYVLVIAANGIDAEMVLAARPKIYASEFYPKPGTIVTACEAIRQRVLDARKAEELARYVPCVNPKGEPTLAPPERVQAGALLPPGDTSGDGSHFVQTLPSRRTGRGREEAAIILQGGANPLRPSLPKSTHKYAQPEDRAPTTQELIEADRARERIRSQARASKEVRREDG